LLGSCRKGLNNQLKCEGGVSHHRNCWAVSDWKQQKIWSRNF
jgi:hypothetical protein